MMCFQVVFYRVGIETKVQAVEHKWEMGWILRYRIAKAVHFPPNNSKQINLYNPRAVSVHTNNLLQWLFITSASKGEGKNWIMLFVNKCYW